MREEGRNCHPDPGIVERGIWPENSCCGPYSLSNNHNKASAPSFGHFCESGSPSALLVGQEVGCKNFPQLRASASLVVISRRACNERSRMGNLLLFVGL